MQKLIEKENILKTKIIASSDNTKTYVLTKTIEGLQGGRGVFILLYPTRTTENLHVEDSTNMHLLNHLKELGLSEYIIVNLFSTVTQSKLSTRGLLLDRNNLDYIKNNIFKSLDNATDKVIIAWGNSLQTSKTVNQAKLEILKMWTEMHKNTELYQLTTTGLKKDNIGVHPLYMGIRYTNAQWSLETYPLSKVMKELTAGEKKEPVQQNAPTPEPLNRNASKLKAVKKA